MTGDIEWIKLSTAIFNDDKMKVILSMPDGEALFNTWIRILCLAGRINEGGQIYITKDLPYSNDTLSTVLNIKIQLTKMALDAFQRLGIIYIREDGIICITNWEKHQNIEGLEKVREQNKLRVRNYRQRLLSVGGDNYRQYTGMVTERDGNRCVYCGSEENLVIDHLIPLLRGGDNQPDNLVTACRRCNSGKQGKLLEEIGYKFLNSEKYEQLKKVTERLAVMVRNHTEIERDKEDIEREEEKSPILDIEKNIVASDDSNRPKPSVPKMPKISFSFEEAKWVNLSEEDGKRWGEAYPACDIRTELCRMREWLLANPSKRKSNYRRFIQSWLTRAQDNGGTKTPAGRPGKAKKCPRCGVTHQAPGELCLYCMGHPEEAKRAAI